uniref:Microsomal glutathione S-transferase 1 n=3 Tax=Oryzias melastigma TaxID=30732 RepID=A0A3B3DSV0_ORYME
MADAVSTQEVECLQALAPPPVFSRKCYCETQSELLSCRDARRSAKMAELLKDQVFMAFTTHAAIVTLKLLLMGPLTGYFRITRKSFVNAEDVPGKTAEDKKKMLKPNEDVERVRRCHQNDLENIIPFVFISLLYTLTAPPLSTALIHFRIFTVSRFCHTISYILALPQPSRGLSYVAGVGATVSMGVQVLLKVLVL